MAKLDINQELSGYNASSEDANSDYLDHSSLSQLIRSMTEEDFIITIPLTKGGAPDGSDS